MATITKQALLDLTVESLCDHHGLKYDGYYNLRMLVLEFCKFDIDPYTDGGEGTVDDDEYRVFVPYRFFDYFKNICMAVKELAEDELSASEVAAVIESVPFQESNDCWPVDNAVVAGMRRLKDQLRSSMNSYAPLPARIAD
jgi:hypothetical protein